MQSSRYALLEDEQRFVVPRVPDGAHEPREIEDRYVRGTRLRLRVVRWADRVERKLGHKVPAEGRRPAVWHTTVYLEPAEYDLLATLPADVLRKRRRSVQGGSCDEFLGALEGLVLVEGDRPMAAPRRGTEVTMDRRFTGGALAALDLGGALELLEVARGLAR